MQGLNEKSFSALLQASGPPEQGKVKMNLLAHVYGAGVQARNALYSRGALPVQRLQGPVVRIGNLSVGGSGKTPFVILLGGLLRDRAVKFDVFSRAYGRKTRGTILVAPGGSARVLGHDPPL